MIRAVRPASLIQRDTGTSGRYALIAQLPPWLYLQRLLWWRLGGTDPHGLAGTGQ